MGSRTSSARALPHLSYQVGSYLRFELGDLNSYKVLRNLKAKLSLASYRRSAAANREI